MTDIKTREQTLLDHLANAHAEYTRHSANANSCISEATAPCDGNHECEEDHDGDQCDCDLDCSCPSADESRQDAAIEATLAQAAAQAMNTYALMLAHKL